MKERVTDNIRETAIEYETNGEVVLMIRDPNNSFAWIKSTVSMPLEQ